MKKLLLVAFIVLFAAGIAVGLKWSEYGDQTAGQIADTDTFLVRDTSDTSLAATGTQKEYPWSVMKTDLETWLEALNPTITGNYDFGGGNVELPNSTGDLAMSEDGRIGMQLTDDLLVADWGAAGEAQGEVAWSVLEHLVLTMDPSWAYDQESTYRSVPLMYVGDDFPNGFTIVEIRVQYVGGNPTTELDADIICDTTPDFNTAAGATVMDVIDTTTGSMTADSGFDSATCANGSEMYVHFGADPTDANVLVTINIWGYAEAD